MEIIKQIKKMENGINEKLKNNKIFIRIIENEEKNKGTIILAKENKINRAFNIEVTSNAQINISENGKLLERGWFIDRLGEWLFNLYNPVKYFYVFQGGKLNGKVLSRRKIDKLSDEITIDFHEERERGLPVPPKTIDNQPKVKGYLGPMFEDIDFGKIYLRYETQDIYNMNSI